MEEIFSRFEIRLLPETLQRVQMDDPTYFGPKYKDYVSNSKMGLLNPAQGGSPQKFFEGFKSNNSPALALGSATHQLTLEDKEYELSKIITPSGKLGKFLNLFTQYLEEYRVIDLVLNTGKIPNGSDEFITLCEENLDVQKAALKAAMEAEYYLEQITNYNGTDLPSRLKTALVSIYSVLIADKPEKTKDNKKLIYLPSDQHAKCTRCVRSLKENQEIQDALNWENSYCEDVILGDVEVKFPKDFNNPNSEMETTIVKLKIKIDNWTIDHDKKIFSMNDLKTSGKAVQYFMGYNVKEAGFMGEEKEVFKPGSWQTFHYYRQSGMYSFLLKNYIEKEYGPGYRMMSRFFVVETVGNFYSKMFTISKEEMVRGFKEFTELLKRVAFHQVRGYENILEFEVNNLGNLNLDI